MKLNRNWIIVLILAATAGFIALQNRVAPAPVDVIETPSITSTSTITFTDTPTVTPAYEGCAYMWAYHDAPELTQKIDSAIRAIDPAASANVNLFGEDCIFADGHSTFGAMETDFYVHLPVNDLANEEVFGNWMAQVLPLIAQIPREEIQGSYGFVEFWFEKTSTEKVVVRVPIQQYKNEAQGKTGAELFRMFFVTP